MPVNDPQPIEKQPDSNLNTEMASDETEAVSSLDSLSRAIGVGFRVLRVLMVVLAVVFCFSNIYWVPEGFVAVQTRFGKIVGEKGAAVRLPGGPYLAFPYPMDKIVRIPPASRKLRSPRPSGRKRRRSWRTSTTGPKPNPSGRASTGPC